MEHVPALGKVPRNAMAELGLPFSGDPQLRKCIRLVEAAVQIPPWSIAIGGSRTVYGSNIHWIISIGRPLIHPVFSESWTRPQIGSNAPHNSLRSSRSTCSASCFPSSR
jgi:hypothetical protein